MTKVQVRRSWHQNQDLNRGQWQYKRKRDEFCLENVVGEGFMEEVTMELGLEG